MAAVARQIIPVFLWVHLHGALLVGTCTEECTGTLMAGHALRNVLIILVLDNTIDIGYNYCDTQVSNGGSKVMSNFHDHNSV